VHRGNFSLIAAVIDLKRITVPVFLIYAGVIHVIGLALLLPMIVTLPGPGSMIAPKGAPVTVELDAEADPDLTAALPPAEPDEDKAPLQAAPEPAAPEKADAKPVIPGALADASPMAQPAKPVLAAPQPKSQAKPAAASSGKAVKKTVVRRSTRPTVRHSASKDTNIAPFAGGMSGLFTPGAPAKRK
jgi:hypothetical protein